MHNFAIISQMATAGRGRPAIVTLNFRSDLENFVQRIGDFSKNIFLSFSWLALASKKLFLKDDEWKVFDSENRINVISEFLNPMMLTSPTEVGREVGRCHTNDIEDKVNY